MAAVTITDYASLQSATADWLNRADLVDQIPAFITLTEAQFNRELRLRDMMVRADATSSNEYVEIPDDWLETYSLTMAPGTEPSWPLVYCSEKESNEIKSRSYGTAGPVTRYTIINGAFELVPAPGSNVNLKLVYYAKIPSLGDSNPSNWLLAKSPDLYLYSTVLQAMPYLKDDDRLPTWVQIRGGLMEAIKLESEASMRPRSGLVAYARRF